MTPNPNLFADPFDFAGLDKLTTARINTGVRCGLSWQSCPTYPEQDINALGLVNPTYIVVNAAGCLRPSPHPYPNPITRLQTVGSSPALDGDLSRSVSLSPQPNTHYQKNNPEGLNAVCPQGLKIPCAT